MSRSYDWDGLGNQLLLDLPMMEGVGASLVRDAARPHHAVTLVDSPTWAQLSPSGAWVLTLNGTTEYLQATNAVSADLGFTTGAFSLACWCYWTGDSADIIMGRYELDVGGWELYFDDTDPLRTLTLRAHHAGDPAGNRTAATSYGWTKSNWWLVGVSRSGAYPLHYRNGLGQEMTYSASGIANPAATASDLVIGARYSKDANFYAGSIKGVRVWNRALAPWEHRSIFNRERHLFNV